MKQTELRVRMVVESKAHLVERYKNNGGNVYDAIDTPAPRAMDRVQP